MSTNLRKRLNHGELALGTILSLNSPDAAEILSKVGFDWLFIDGEHGTFDTHELQAILQAAGKNCECVFRIPALDEVHIKKALDVAPMVSSRPRSTPPSRLRVSCNGPATRPKAPAEWALRAPRIRLRGRRISPNSK